MQRAIDTTLNINLLRDLRVKLLQRQAYGRAGLPYLQRRFLQAAYQNSSLIA
jgi:hypothetical protein